MPQDTIIGIDIGGTKTAVVEGTSSAEILQRLEIPTEGHRPVESSFARVIGLIEETVAEATKDERKPIAISVSAPGPLKIDEGVFIDPPNMPGWHGARFKEELERNFPTLRVFVEHDGNAGALAEFHFGAGLGRMVLAAKRRQTVAPCVSAGLTRLRLILREAQPRAT